MDCIDRAIKNGRAVSKFDELNAKTWEMFDQIVSGKKIFLFGAGAATGVFFQRNVDQIALEGIIDNDISKQGFNFRDISEAGWEYLDEDILISDPSVLEKYEREDVVVLICSLRYVDEIAEHLLQKGIIHIYSLLLMEATKRKQQEKCSKITDVDEIQVYVKQCINKEIQKRKIIFRAFGNYADHGKYITEVLLKEEDNLDLVWIVSDFHVQLPEGVRKVWIGNRKKLIYEYETAKIWISDLPVPDYIQKRQGQFYIQTKHWASVTLKKFYLDTKAFQKEPEKIRLWMREGSLIDYIITGSEFDKESCKRGFKANCKYIEAGSPRTDAMFRPEEMRKKVIAHYGISEEKRLLIYAPTYRFDLQKGNSVHTSRNIELDFEQTKNALERKFGGEWCILIRLHPSVSKACDAFSFPDYVVNVSAYEDSQELASAADIMISDYSSIMFEPAFVRKPVFLFTTDKKEYIDQEYDLLIDYDTLPFPIAESNEELADCILNFDMEQYKRQVDDFMDQYGVCEDGHASERAARAIVELL